MFSLLNPTPSSMSGCGAGDHLAANSEAKLDYKLQILPLEPGERAMDRV